MLTIGKFSRSLKSMESFFVRSPNQAIFMIEFFEDDYHVYGIKRATRVVILELVKGLCRAFQNPGYRKSLLTGRVVNLRDAMPNDSGSSCKTSHTKILWTTTAFYTIWADKGNGPRRFGVALWNRFPANEAHFLRELTEVALNEDDLIQISMFLHEKTRRYRDVRS